VCSNHQRVGEPGRPCLPWKQEIGGSNPSTLTTTLEERTGALHERHQGLRGARAQDTRADAALHERGSAVKGVRCADGRLGYAHPIGGVVAYE
jgi:hypothetical protein